LASGLAASHASTGSSMRFAIRIQKMGLRESYGV
jgi:hypothetical protein